MKPKRIQLRRTKGYRKPPGAVVVSRPSRFSNPFRAHTNTVVPAWYVCGSDHEYQSNDPVPVYVTSVDHAVAMFRVYAMNRLRREPGWLDELRGKDLCCWCGLDRACHADVILELANGGT